MRRWTILTSVLIIGTAVAIGVWFFVRMSTTTTLDTSAPIQEQSFFSFFSKEFGLTASNPSTTTSTSPVTPTAGPTFREILKRDKLIALGNGSLAGETFVSTTSTTSVPATATASSSVATTTLESVRYVERENGNIHDFSLETGLDTRITNTTIPRVHEALFGNHGSIVALRYLDDDNETIETFVASIPNVHASSTDLVGTFFPQNIRSIALNASSSDIFYITTTTDRAVGRISNPTNTSTSNVFASPLREWVGAWINDTNLIVGSTPSTQASGVLQLITRAGTAPRQLASGFGITGLTNPAGTKLLYATAGTQSVRLFVLTLATHNTLELPVQTFPEKCVWKNNDVLVCAVPNSLPKNVPDVWYQGRVSFTDTLWNLDTSNEQYDFLYAPESTEARQSMDIVNLRVSRDGSIVSFINKKDLRGWLADVSVGD